LLADAADLESQFRASGRQQSVTLRLGSIDSAAVGMVPRLLHDFRTQRPDVEIRLFEDSLAAATAFGPHRSCFGSTARGSG
jgi:DNA-binding transcriptional LysR family regulator